MARTKQPKTKALTKVVDVEVAERNLPVAQSAEALIAQAIDRGTPVETMEKLLAMRRELKAEFAKEEFDKAMANFQSSCPIIKKSKKVLNRDKQSTRYSYAPLDVIVQQVRGLIKDNGFSYKVDADVAGETVTAVCTITHRAGHSESSKFQIPIDKEAFMNKQQQFASALTFAKRYAFCDAFGILTGDEDDDGRIASLPPEQRKEAEKKQDEKVDCLTRLKHHLFKAGAKTEAEALEVYNSMTGESRPSLKVSPAVAKDMLYSFMSTPAMSNKK
ncbi:MAG: ERF family protein [Parcubacteria group bacterium]|jgi:hypothetical protein